MSASRWTIRSFKLAADVSAKFQKDVDEKTAHERLRDKPERGEIGCQVHHRVPGKTQGGRTAARWHLVSLPDGTVVRAPAVQAFPVEQLCSKEAVDGAKGVPQVPGHKTHIFVLSSSSNRRCR